MFRIGYRSNGKKTSPLPSSPEQLLVELRQVSKLYRTPAGQFTALDNIDLMVPKGDFVSIVGKSGSGKSTLINMITGIDQPSQGDVLVNGTAVHTLTEEQIAVWRGGNLGVIFQFFQLLPTLTAVENILLAMDYGARYPMSERPDRALHLLELVGMTDCMHKLPAELSGGQQQAVAIARGLANDPPLLTADEPTGNLDSKAAAVVMNLFESLVDGGKTILMVTHDPDLALRTLRTVTLADGRIIDEKNHQARE